ncbi:peptide-methionine (S)-S-oxide reductase MsrA [Marinomonas posidonica]|uniref:Peptide methionine sulfoxide reductase MsrA n=1 Tax=Marinomonas posidonica (strain CECT 7376 / NCIMB 14433 / IVIA-Po-181) TaxID=491952 RepID=F6CT14_MARPP|nr:peptide-methionine (S)-S-oxide reductase MsrA [Marinomonas posidonica]AEF55072.1 Peptide methionine sulfoxide reductase msrA [Marinomonas posidonica IVIA-Po-181]
MSNLIEQILKKSSIPSKTEALSGRDMPIKVSGIHAVNGKSFLREITPNEAEVIIGMGCFWGAERMLWNTPGVIVTSVGYAGGYTKNPTYEEVCTGQTGHSEVVQVIYDTKQTNLQAILKVFWENHDPTQGMRQGNDVGSQYRSVIYTYSDEDIAIAEASKNAYQKELLASGHAMITTEIEPLDVYYFAEEYHQQYLHKNPNGYCGLAGTGVSCPIGLMK